MFSTNRTLHKSQAAHKSVHLHALGELTSKPLLLPPFLCMCAAHGQLLWRGSQRPYRPGRRGGAAATRHRRGALPAAAVSCATIVGLPLRLAWLCCRGMQHAPFPLLRRPLSLCETLRCRAALPCCAAAGCAGGGLGHAGLHHGHAREARAAGAARGCWGVLRACWAC